MDQKLETALALCRDPMLAVEHGKTVYMNAAAHAAFPGGASAAPPLPDHILFSETERFVAAVEIEGTQYNVSCARLGETRLFSLAPQNAAENDGLLSDGLMTDMLSTLFNVGLAVDRVAAFFPPDAGEDTAAGRFLLILRHNYYSLQRQLGNLNTARLLRDGSACLSPRRTDLTAFCAGLVDSIESLPRPGRAPLRFSTAEEELVAWVDPRKVERILLNLLMNSFAHTPPDGEVLLRLAKSGGNAVLSVDDNGEGIPEDVLRNIFARYETRLDGARLDRGPTGGLGLGVASGLAKLHGGALVIESREGHGTSVRAMLPLERPGSVMLESGGTPEPMGMRGILTELSGLLGPECYAAKYLD